MQLEGMIHGLDPKGALARSILGRPDRTGDLALATSIPTPDPKGDLAPPILVRPDPKGDLAPPILVRPDPTGDLAPRILVPPDPQGGFSPAASVRRTTLGGRHRGLRPVGDHVDRSGGVRDREHAGHAGVAGRRPTSGRLSHGRHPSARPLHGSEHARQVDAHRARSRASTTGAASGRSWPAWARTHRRSCRRSPLLNTAPPSPS